MKNSANTIQPWWFVQKKRITILQNAILEYKTKNILPIPDEWHAELLMLQAFCKAMDCLPEISKENIKELEHFMDTSIGLWCIDQDPKDVTKEWIEKNAFQLTK